MDELYAGGLIFGAFATMVAVFMGGYSIGKYDGKSVGEVEMRPKVVLYCIEKPQLCKEEYTSIKTQQKLNDYKLPEIK
jgi:hypothetical protein